MLLYVNLQEEYKTLINKYNNETNQHKIIVEKLKRDIKGIEEKYQNQIIDNQRYQNKIKLQEPRINQLQQDVKLKENQLKKYRIGNDEIAHVATTKLRQYIYSILNNRGFANIYGEDHITYEHPFIAYYKEELDKTMNELRIVKGQEKIASENLAAIIICEVTKIFWFRLKIHESVIQYVWIPCDVQVNEVFMEGNNFDDDNDNDNLYVGLCYFPLIGRDLTSSNNREVYSLAKVFVQRNQHQI
uniref:Uncharacterized protein n=1 Tax=Rhizophagus irregularis (strain DAOM 181602 / DAOM 197198 / MUCL 43194) TaxID=747089 RepID=U9UIQ1_RHIID